MHTIQLDERLFRTDADNGVTVLSEALPSVRSTAVGIWIKSASVHEDRAKMGVSHLLEHMVFKGTERRSARDIATALEVRGGALDAFTARAFSRPLRLRVDQCRDQHVFEDGALWQQVVKLEYKANFTVAKLRGIGRS